tara:strand:- start:95162 stop:95713 length:552 start_codon:yes stop_codon:yes gene_type:complete
MQLSGQAQPKAVPTRDQLLERLVAVASKRAYRIANDLLRNRAEAEDAVQESLIDVCRSHGSLRDEALAEAWFLRIVTRRCLRILRRRRLKEAFWGSANAAPNSSTSADGEQRLSGSQQAQLLVRHLQRLPTMQRSTLTLRYGHDLSVEEIAILMDIKPSSVKTHLVRGMRRLRLQILPEGEIE